MSTVARREPCPACQAAGKDTQGDNLTIFDSGGFSCVVLPYDREHTRVILAARGGVHRGGAVVLPFKSKRPISNPRVSRANLLNRIREDYPYTLADLWESSPVRCEGKRDDVAAFLQLFPEDATLWIAPDVYRSSKPEHARFFRTREEWQAETLSAPGTRIAPASFRPGSFTRGRESVHEHLFAVIETDDVGPGKLYADKDEFCSLLQWLREACGWHLAAVVDSGGKSLHGWFRHPGLAEVSQLKEHAVALGLDDKFLEPSQPWRLPGVNRENSDRWQQLLYLDHHGVRS